MESRTDHAWLTIVAANREQTLEFRRLTYQEWGPNRGLTLEQYLSRELEMDGHEHAADGRLITWVLVPRNDTRTLNFKCACWTFRRPSYARFALNSAPQEVIGYGITAVFCPPENRGKGYASHMMRLLHWVLAPREQRDHQYALSPGTFPTVWGDPPPTNPLANDATFSVLYSDIGPQFYQSCGPTGGSDGWTVRDPVGTTWDVANYNPNPIDEPNQESVWLSEDDCKTVWNEDAELLHRDLSASPSTKTLFTFRPDNGVGTYQIRRTDFFLPGINRAMPTKWGARIIDYQESKTRDESFATWTIDIQPPSTLIVTRLRSKAKAFPVLVNGLITAAREMDIERVEVWNLPEELVPIASQLNGHTEARDEHLNAFKWYGSEMIDEVEWMFNERFAWC